MLKFHGRWFLPLFVLFFILCNAAVMCAYYMVSHLTCDAAVLYTVYFCVTLLQFLMPVVLAAQLLALAQSTLSLRCLLWGILPALTRLCYTVPDRYIFYMESGLDTPQSLLLAGGWGLLGVGVLYGASVVLFLAAHCIFSRRKKDMPIRVALETGGAFDTSAPLARACYALCVPVFLVYFVIECIQTVQYLNEYSGTYTTGEIFYIIGKFVFLFVSLVIGQALAVWTVRKIEREYMTDMPSS